MAYQLSQKLKEEGFGSNLTTLGLMNEPENRTIKYIGKIESFDGLGIICFNEDKEVLFDCLIESCESISDGFYEMVEYDNPTMTDEEIEKVAGGMIEDHYSSWKPSDEKGLIEDILFHEYGDGGEYILSDSLIYLGECN